MTTDLPDPADIGAWRSLIHAAGDRPARADVVRSWAVLLGCTFGEGDDAHLIHPPTTGLPGNLAGAVWHHALTSGLYLKPPAGGWPPDNRLPEWTRVP